jgi:N-acetylglutamate synthase-like GNAT family acetyltransferase
MALTESQAQQIAALLNARNQLVVHYTAEKVQEHADDYLFQLSDAGDVVACVEVKRVQWYQAEILHLCVAKPEARKGRAKQLLASAEELARERGARILQCTIRAGNPESEGLFLSVGFYRVSTFHHDQSGNNVSVLQKVLAPAR